MSLSSIIKDWCESLDQQVFEQLFTDGTDRCLALLRMVSNDEETFVSRLAKATTDLRLEDWNDQTLEKCLLSLERCKKNAEVFHEKIDKADTKELESESDSYQISFALEDGQSVVKRFERVSTSNRGKLLQNKIVADIDSFGQALTDAEKRQILMDVLKKLC